MKITTTIVLATVASSMLAIAAMTYAQTGPTGATGPAAPTGSGGQMMMGNGPHHTQMMVKLVAACVGKKANDPCSFTRANGTTSSGTCETGHAQLLCMPAGMMMYHGTMGGTGATGGMGHMGNMGGSMGNMGGSMGNMGGGTMMGSPSSTASPGGQ